MDIDSVAESSYSKICELMEDMLHNMYLTLSERHKDVENPKWYRAVGETVATNDFKLVVPIRLTMCDNGDDTIIDYMDSKIIVELGEAHE